MAKLQIFGNILSNLLPSSENDLATKGYIDSLATSQKTIMTVVTTVSSGNNKTGTIAPTESGQVFYHYTNGDSPVFSFNTSGVNATSSDLYEFYVVVRSDWGDVVTFPSSWIFSSSLDSSGASAVSIVHVFTKDGGTVWYADLSGYYPLGKKTGATIQLQPGTGTKVGEYLRIDATVTSDMEGYISCSYGGVEYTGTILSGQAHVNINGLTAGSHTLQVTTQSTNYVDVSGTVTVTITKNTAPLSVDAVENEGEVTIVLGQVVPDYDGTATISIDGKTYTIDLSRIRRCTIYRLNPGTYNFTATFAETDKYYGTTATGSVVVTQYRNPPCSIGAALDNNNISAGSNAVIRFSDVPEDVIGNAVCTAEFETGETINTYTANLAQSSVLEIPNLPVGYLVLRVTYSLNNYNDESGGQGLTTHVTGQAISVSYVTLDITGSTANNRSSYDTVMPLIHFSSPVNDLNVQCSIGGRTYSCAVASPGVYRVLNLIPTNGMSDVAVSWYGSHTYEPGNTGSQSLRFYTPNFRMSTINNPVMGEDIVVTGYCGSYSGTQVICKNTATNTTYNAVIQGSNFSVNIPTSTTGTYNLLIELSYSNNNANNGYATMHLTLPPVIVNAPAVTENCIKMTIEVEDDDQVSFGTTTEDDVLYPVTVYWGDGDSDIVTDDYLFSHTYEDAGTYELIIRSQDGRLPVMGFGDLGSRLLSVDFTDVEWYEDDGEGGEESTVSCSSMFNGCSSLESIPSTLFARNTNIYGFKKCFRETALASIPSGLFNGVSSGDFGECFANCTSLENIPTDLFSTVEYGYFASCFSYDDAIVPADTKPFVPPVWEKDIDSADIDSGDKTGSYYYASSDIDAYVPDIYGGDIPYKNDISNPQFNDKCWDWDTIEVDEDGDISEYDVIYVYTCVDPGNDEWCRGWIDFSEYDTLVTTLSDSTDHDGTSLRDALENADDNDVIGFAVNGTIVLEQGSLTLPTAVTVDGDNRITIDGDDSYGVFKVVSGESVSGCTLKNLTMVNGNDDNDAFGAIGLSGLDLTVEGCVIKECSHDSIYVWDEGDLTVRNSSISNGTGGIYVYGADVEMTDCSLTRCSNYGIYIEEGDETAQLRMSGCTVSNNGYYLEDEGTEDEYVAMSDYDLSVGICSYYGTLDISDSVFSSNYCSEGAVIYLQGGSMTLANSTFCPGSVEYSDLEDSYSADKIWINNANATIDRCVFRDNRKMNWMGYAQIDNDSSNDDYKVTFNRCLFTGNAADKEDFSFVHISESSSVAFANTIFTGNDLSIPYEEDDGDPGYCVRIVGASNSYLRPTVNIINCTFTNNTNGGMYCFGDAGSSNSYGSLDISNTVSVGCSEDAMAGNGTVNYNCFLDDHDYGDIDYNPNRPLFAEDGYTPVANSQVIDEGDDSLYDENEYGDEDFNGDERIFGDYIDLGAVEYGPHI